MADDLPAFERTVLSVVQAALAAHGTDSADTHVEWSATFGGWIIEVTPRNAAAAHVSIACDGEELLLSFGRTRLELWNSKSNPSPIEQLASYLSAIFDGDVEEAGSGHDRFARVYLGNGKHAFVGRAHFPWPWSWRRRHRYASYS